MEKIPYSSLMLIPWSDSNTTILESVTKRGYCLRRMKEVLLAHTVQFREKFNASFPVEPKVFYFVPFNTEKKTLKIHGLKQAEYSALYLPSIAIIDNKTLPKEVHESSIVASDEDFSIFTDNQYMLAIDLSKRRKDFIFLDQEESKPSSLQKKFYLAESLIA